jgi:hypothetical protein
MTNHQWLLARRPVGLPKESDFEWREQETGDPGDGRFLARNVYLSLDPTNRGWMNESDTYLPAVRLGEVMRGITLGIVEKSRHPGFAEGDIVQGLGGWQDYFLSDGTGVSKLARIAGLPLSAHFGAMGHIGFTAYFGLFDIGKPKAGETVVVSAAAGAVGSLAGQMAKLAGCRVVGIAGSDEKCRWITGELGFDAAINYRTADLRDELKRHCPGGIDVDFENVGGEIMEAVIDRLNYFSRIALCGLISQYNSAAGWGPRNFAALLIKRVTCRGFIVTDFAPRFAEATQAITGWLREGTLKYRLDVIEGLHAAPAGLTRLFDGSNTGKLLVRVSPEPA